MSCKVPLHCIMSLLSHFRCHLFAWLQQLSLKLLPEQFDFSQPGAAASLLQILPNLLVALSSPHRDVRSAALKAIGTMADSSAMSDADLNGSNGAADSGMSPQHLGALLAALAGAEAAVAADPDAAVQLLTDTLAAAPISDAKGLASEPARTPARRGRARRAQLVASDDATVGCNPGNHSVLAGCTSSSRMADEKEHKIFHMVISDGLVLVLSSMESAASDPLSVDLPCSPLQLAGAAAAAAGAALAGLLGGLTAPADATAARIVLRVLAAWGMPAARLQTALPLLQALAPAARSATAANAAALALSALSVSAPPAAHLEPAAAAAAVHTEVTQLFVEALALYKPEAVAALAAAADSLMQPLADAGWALKRGQRAEPAERAAARRLSTRELHDALPAPLQQQMYLVSNCCWSISDTCVFYTASCGECDL